jgi:hypothetical protein
MAQIVLKNGEISSSAGINIPVSLSISSLTASFISASSIVGVSVMGGGSTSPGGSDKQIQFNNNGAFGASSNLTFDSATNTLNGTTAQFTTVSSSNIQVNGNITITGSGNGLIFPDGTEIITAANFPVNLLVIAGGGGGGAANTTTTNAGGGGGGGYIESGITTFGEIILSTGKTYRVTVGAGGPGGTSGGQGTNGSDSYFGLNYALGGGGGGGSTTGAGRAGGSGGGSATGASIGTATSRIYQIGNNGGQGNNGLTDDPGGGGGGAGGVGGTPTAIQPRGFGGIGVNSTITGISVQRGGGGGGGVDGGFIVAGYGGGGDGGIPTAGTVNTGGGGGGAGYIAAALNGAAGGSGVIIIKYPLNYSASFTAGVTQSTSTSGSFKITTITAAGSNDTVTFS